jgi:ribosomal protein S18 acetylase RimI-like enzyme
MALRKSGIRFFRTVLTPRDKVSIPVFGQEVTGLLLVLHLQEVLSSVAVVAHERTWFVRSNCCWPSPRARDTVKVACMKRSAGQPEELLRPSCSCRRSMLEYIRAATVVDAEALALLNQGVQELHVAERPEFFKHVDPDVLVGWFRSVLEAAGVRAWIAEVDGSTVGYALTIVHHRAEGPFSSERTFCEIDQIAVSPAFRGRGIGRALVERVLADARSRNIQDVELSTWSFNVAAQAAFRKLGFVPRTVRFERKS